MNTIKVTIIKKTGMDQINVKKIFGSFGKQ